MLTSLAIQPRSFAWFSHSHQSLPMNNHTDPVLDETSSIYMAANKETPLESEMRIDTQIEKISKAST